MQGLPPHLEVLGEARRPTMRDELQEERVVAAVHLVAHDRATQPERVRADLVLPPGVRLDAGEDVAGVREHGLEERRRRQRTRPFAHRGLHDDLAGLVGTERLVHHDGLRQGAFQQGVVGLRHPTPLHRGLRRGGRLIMLGDQDDPARLAVQPADEVQDVEPAPLLHRADERGPRTVLGRMADEPARLVEHQVIVVLLEQPARQLGRVDLGRRAARRHEVEVAHEVGGSRSCHPASGNAPPWKRASTSPTR
mgnify:CR=1 FL=1